MTEQRKIELVDGHFVVKGEKESKVLERKEMLKEKPTRKQYSEEVLALRDRIILGNQKLFDARMQIREMDTGEEKKRQQERFDKARDKLHHLCLELQAKGYEDCLYYNNEGKRTKNCLKNLDDFWCQVCPSSYPYWHGDARIFLFEEDKK